MATSSEGIIIGFDSIGYYVGQILEKPKTRQEALERLKKLSGKEHQFITGICIIKDEKEITRVVKTKAIMRGITDEEINKYLDQDSNYLNYCIGYDPLNYYSKTFLKEIRGSYNNIISGLPVEVITEMLKEI